MKNKEFIYLAFNKPKNCVSALKDNIHKTIIDYLPQEYKKLHIVGRLDKDTEGLIILTNDGKLTHNLTHPKKHIDKTYEVELKNDFNSKYIEKLENPFYIDYGKTLVQGSKVQIINNNKINLTIYEGKFHQVKKMMFNVENEVTNLKRISIGKLKLSNLNLKTGEFCLIKKEDIL